MTATIRPAGLDATTWPRKRADHTCVLERAYFANGTWYCQRCGAVIGTPAIEPGMKECPECEGSGTYICNQCGGGGCRRCHYNGEGTCPVCRGERVVEDDEEGEV